MWLVIPNYFSFALLRPALGCKKRPPSTRTLPIMRKPETNGDLVTSVFPGSTLVTCICFKFYWFIVAFTFVVIGHCNCFGLGLTALKLVWDMLCDTKKAMCLNPYQTNEIRYSFGQGILSLWDAPAGKKSSCVQQNQSKMVSCWRKLLLIAPCRRVSVVS